MDCTVEIDGLLVIYVIHTYIHTYEEIDRNKMATRIQDWK